MADVTTPPNYANCHKVQDSASPPLQRCARCRTTHYCSRDCQKANWAQHKKSCAQTGDNPSTTGPSASASSSSSSAPPFRSTKPLLESMLGLNTATWLSSVPEAEAFTLLIDSYRLRVEDEYAFRGDIADDSVYGGGDPKIGFRRYLRKAEKQGTGGVLPAWWSVEKRQACVAKGDERDHWSSLHFAVEKGDVIEHYGDSMMPMRLRMLAEEIEGSNVMAY